MGAAVALERRTDFAVDWHLFSAPGQHGDEQRQSRRVTRSKQALRIRAFRKLSLPFAGINLGAHGYWRALVAGSQAAADTLLIALGDPMFSQSDASA